MDASTIGKLFCVTVTCLLSLTAAANPREKMKDEITPTSAQLSAKRTGKESNIADYAIDRDWDTGGTSGRDNDDKLWMEFNFDEVYCIKQVISPLKKDDPNSHIFTCSSGSNECACTQGSACSELKVTVSGGEAAEKKHPLDRECKYGNKFKIEYLGTIWQGMNVVDLITIGKRADCGKPEVENGKIEPDSSKTFYEATCNEGFTMAGTPKITCTAGELSTVPICKAKLSSASSLNMKAVFLFAWAALLLIEI